MNALEIREPFLRKWQARELRRRRFKQVAETMFAWVVTLTLIAFAAEIVNAFIRVLWK